ncbi:MAG: amidophosphoribosyltransferase [Planctomycetota bacterium]
MKLGHYCGLFGVHGNADAASITYFGLQALQHRGQEGAGIATTDGGPIRVHADQGLVSDVFREKRTLELLTNPIAIGHVRYSTSGGSSSSCNVQPLYAHCGGIPVALAHNGDLTNKVQLRKRLENEGALFQTTMDSETILHLLAKAEGPDLELRLQSVLAELQGAYTLLLLTPDRLIAVRDPRGFRPLMMGRMGDATVFSSESCAFDLYDEIEDVREIEPGEIVSVSQSGTRSLRFGDPHTKRLSRCIFEQVYFARPDSKIFGRNVHRVRMEFGRQLAREHPVDADIVSAVPDSGNSASMGYSLESGIPLDRSFIKNHYIGRTFITPDPKTRSMKVKVKLNAVREVVEGKRVVVIDDSIIRGTTSLSRMAALKKAGAKEVHLRISCPPTRHPCYFGIDFPTQTELIAGKYSVAEIAKFLNVDSLGYLSEAGMLKCVDGERDSYCLACFNGEYPCATPAEIGE